MEHMVQDHEQRIIKLEHNYSEVQRELTNVQNSQLRTENTVLATSQRQEELLNKLLDHVLGTKTFVLSKKWQLILTLFGGGGAFYIIVDLISKFLIK